MDTRIAPGMRPRLARGVRLHEDRVRGRTVLLAPERVITPNPTALEILRRCDGTRTFAAIIADLARTHETDAGRVEADTGALLGHLVNRRLVEL